jgi:hypothetical protein
MLNPTVMPEAIDLRPKIRRSLSAMQAAAQGLALYVVECPDHERPDRVRLLPYLDRREARRAAQAEDLFVFPYTAAEVRAAAQAGGWLLDAASIAEIKRLERIEA